jgi:regulator of CtrA degradation
LLQPAWSKGLGIYPYSRFRGARHYAIHLLMDDRATSKTLTLKVIDGLYVEAMVLSDEARSYFDGYGRTERDALPPLDRVSFACESMKVTTRLMHVVAWLIGQRARLLDPGSFATQPKLGMADEVDAALLDKLPPDAARLGTTSQDLYDRVARIDTGIRQPGWFAAGAVRRMQRDLERYF